MGSLWPSSPTILAPTPVWKTFIRWSMLKLEGKATGLQAESDHYDVEVVPVGTRELGASAQFATELGAR
jgi:hypothetical protein